MLEVLGSLCTCNGIASRRNQNYICDQVVHKRRHLLLIPTLTNRLETVRTSVVVCRSQVSSSSGAPMKIGYPRWYESASVNLHTHTHTHTHHAYSHTNFFFPLLLACTKGITKHTSASAPRTATFAWAGARRASVLKLRVALVWATIFSRGRLMGIACALAAGLTRS